MASQQVCTEAAADASGFDPALPPWPELSPGAALVAMPPQVIQYASGTWSPVVLLPPALPLSLVAEWRGYLVA